MGNKLKQPNQANFNNKQSQYDSSDISSGKGFSRIGKKDPQKKVVAVIVTFCSGSSYDNLFCQSQQKSEEGTQVSVYSGNSSIVNDLLKAFKNNKSDNDIIAQMLNQIKSVDSDCVVFNWECCSNYSDEKFIEGKNSVMEFTKLMIDKGFMTMFSDFSLKALVHDWDSKYLGPNPFVKTSEHSGNFKLTFDGQRLKQCPSAQLQIVGQMAANGFCQVDAMGGTIVYTVKHDAKQKNEFYDLEVLTIASALHKGKNQCKIKNQTGAAGHVLLRYKSGGHLLTSMGHWVELMKIDTSEKVLFDIAARQYGDVQASRMRQEYNKMDLCMQKQYIQTNAVEFVKKQAPCTNMARKAKF